MKNFLASHMKLQPLTSKPTRPGWPLPRLEVRSLAALIALIALLAIAAPLFAQIVGSTQLNIERRGHTATLLDDGNVLIVGGDNQSGMVGQAELLDPLAQASSVSGSLVVSRSDHSATKLADGRVLIIGGRDPNGALASSEIYNPLTATFTSGPSMAAARSGHTATVLADGNILIAGGSSSAEIYNPATESFSPLAAGMNTGRKFHSAIRMNSGQVLIVGGVDAQDTVLNTAEVFDPASQTFYLPPTDMQAPRALATLKLLPDSKVQIIGGDAELSMEVFDPADGIFIAKALLPPNTSLLGATLSTQSRAALFSPLVTQDPLLQGILTPEQSVLLDRADQSITELPARNQALVAGGINSTGQFLNSAKLVSSSSASITTDKTDYAPGQIVTITGTGFQPNEQVDIYFHEFPEEYPDIFLSAVANQQGSFVATEFAPQQIDIGRIFTVTAIGRTSGFAAQTAFSDGNLDSKIAFTLNSSVGPLNVAAGSTINWSASATCDGSGAGPNSCAANGFTNGGAVADTYSLAIQSHTNPAFPTAGRITEATASTSGGTGNVNGSFTAPTAVGTYYYRADHSSQIIGSNTWKNATSSSITVNVFALRTTATNVSCSPGTVPVNSGTTCTATVTDTDSAPTSTPTGTVTFSLPGGDAGSFSSTTCSLSSGSCFVTHTPSAVGDGTHSIGASYGGDTTHAISSDPTPFDVTVTRRAISTSIAFATNPVILGGSTQVTVTVTDTDVGTKSSPGVGTTIALSSDVAGDAFGSTCVLAVLNGDQSRCQVTLTPALAIGLHTITANFSVTAIHQASAQSAGLSVIFDFTGFFRPIDNLAVVNKVNPGSSVPIKFSLSGYQGMNIFTYGYPRSASMTCYGDAPSDYVDEVSTPGSSGLTYDPGTDQYHYVWKTEKSWGNSCRRLAVMLSDGQTYYADFSFKK